MAWRRKHLDAGLCVLCSRKLFTKNHCQIHAEKIRKYSRNQKRLKRGIDINAPLHNRSKYVVDEWLRELNKRLDNKEK